jgi:hypothetical protein
MSTWRHKALEYVPALKPKILASKDRQSLWKEVKREFHEALERGDSSGVTGSIRYALWTLNPTPQATTMADVSALAAQFLYDQADNLHRWISRNDFMASQRGLRFHLGEQRFLEFEARFLEKTARYPRQKGAKQASHR